jgi:pimeloyl-ACP methyl ester carboxylesterase
MIINILSFLFSANPTFLIHGIGGSQKDLLDIQKSLEENNYPVFSLSVQNSIFGSMDKMCESVANQILIHTMSNHSKTNINLIGISQGGLLARCFVERYSSEKVRVASLITYGTPHMGIYYKISPFPISFLEYWKDPYQYNKYLRENKFLRFLNNDVIHANSSLYKARMESLSNFVMFWSGIDDVIQPRESAAFEFYNISLAEERKELEIINFERSSQNLENKIGLGYLKKAGNFMNFRFDCLHEKFKHPECFRDFIVNGSTILNLTLKYLE